MNIVIEILTGIVLAGSIIGGGAKGLTKMTRLVDAVERVSNAMEETAGQIGDHEARLRALESRKADA